MVSECLAIRDEARRAAELASPFDVMRAPGRFPTLLRYRRATLARVMDEHLDDPRAKAVLAAFWPYLGLPPSRVSFLYFATMLLSYAAEGAFYCKGSFQGLARALAGAVERAAARCCCAARCGASAWSAGARRAWCSRTGSASPRRS